MESHRHLGNGLAVVMAALVTVVLSAGPIRAAGFTVTPLPQAARLGGTITPSPQMVQAGNKVTITGSGFAQCTDTAGNTVELSANGTLLAKASGSGGNFQQVITVPSGAPAGPYRVDAQCSAQPGITLAWTSVGVVTLALSPSSGAPDTMISVTGGGYTQCQEVQLELLRDATQAVAAGSPIVPGNGSITAELTVPSGAVPGSDYQVDAGCSPAIRVSAPVNAAIAVEQFTVTSPATSGSPTASSPSASSTSGSPSASSSSPSSSSPSSASSSASPSQTQSGAGSASSSGSPSPSTATSPQLPGSNRGRWAPVALIGGTSAGLACAALLLARALSMVHGRRGRGWVSKHLRVVAGRAGPLSAAVERRPGATSVSVGLEPHLDHLGNQQYEEATR
jgi:hypothetical protein